jgi:Flp pilus assembly protein TadD
MIKHWAAIQHRETPQDVLLEESERFFYAALSIQPDEPSALNGLGSVLILRHDLDAAEFFIRRALAKTQAQGLSYAAAEHDLQLVLRMKKQPQP